MRFHLVDTHPENDGYYPGLAKEWAVDKSNNTVYFRLDPEAKYSDGNPVKATDYFFCLYFMRSPTFRRLGTMIFTVQKNIQTSPFSTSTPFR